MNNSDIIKTLDKGNGKMKTWELANDFIKQLEQEMEAEDGGAYKWPKMVGALQCNLGTILIQLSVYHPEAFEMIVEKNFKQLATV